MAPTVRYDPDRDSWFFGDEQRYYDTRGKFLDRILDPHWAQDRKSGMGTVTSKNAAHGDGAAAELWRCRDAADIQ